MQSGPPRPPAPPFRPPKRTQPSNNKEKAIDLSGSPHPNHPNTSRTRSSANEINEQVKRSKATWSDETTKIFCEVCAEEVHAGNRPHTHFSKIGWNNVVIKFQQRSGKKYDQKQLKNKWEKLKMEYATWKNLVEKETGLGWDHEKNTIVASDQWWALQEQANPSVAKFREAGIQNLTELEIMFAIIIVSATTSWNPYSQDDIEIEDLTTIGNEEIEDEEQVDITMDGSINETISQQLESESIDKIKVNTTSEEKGKKTQKGNKSKVSTAKLMQNELKRIVGAMENFSQSSATVTSKRTDLPGCSIGECLTLLATTPGVEIGSELYMLGTRLFVKREYREMFVGIPDENIRSCWLEQELEREKKASQR
ncbi:L10-interacting MYB domain-containing protein-like [Chenopodium quinoa]|uniref:L10-interacting MYB domain-containing protein-like n=1 Tax=Chenopodium quinoa TaxID=63459 RepID=UPI000B77F923|nr:L10-interacting MYB domain-containing protein-like [Chenopodium quinoa]